MSDSARAGLFFESDLTNSDLEQILRRIDENLELRPVLSQHAAGEAAAGRAPLPDPADLPLRLQGLQQLRAPLFVIFGRSWRDMAKQALNLPIRVFGRKQIAFNRDLLEALQIVVACLQDVRRFAEHQLHQNSQHDLQLQGHQAQLEQLARELLRHQAILDKLAADQRGQTPQPRLPEPRIVDPERYAGRLAQLGDRLRVNLACGEQPWPDYINVDLRETPDAEIVADARRLPFEDGSLAEIASAQLVQHFREHQLRTELLPYWRRLLRPGGLLRVICPNWQAMLDRLQRGELSMADFKLLTFGGQSHEGDQHLAMYTPETLGALLGEAGFERVEVLAAERMNGLCPEMELVAYI